MNETPPFARLAGACVHLFTASGAAVGLVALGAAFEGRFAAMFGWLGLALFIDGIDGTFARMADVKKTQPHIDGEILDLVVDFLTYVVVPAAALWRSDLLPPAAAEPLAMAVAMASAFYFADARMKTPDLWFAGFPAIWNVLVFYLFVFRPGQIVSAFIVVAGIALMFAPIVFVHPLRVARFRVLTLAATAAFAFAAIAAVLQNLDPSWPVQAALAACALYFCALPLLRTAPKPSGS